MEILVASKNAHKIKEIEQMLGIDEINLKSLSDMNFSGEIEENGSTFEENALIKARTVCKLFGIPSIADDSGLCVDYLGGAPGIYSARYASQDGKNATDSENVEKLLKNLGNISEDERTARFVSAIALVFPDGREICVKGTCEGIITSEARGKSGFGYDPVFYYVPFCKTFAEITDEEKNRVSHRRVAINLLKKELCDILNV